MKTTTRGALAALGGFGFGLVLAAGLGLTVVEPQVAKYREAVRQQQEQLAEQLFQLAQRERLARQTEDLARTQGHRDSRQVWSHDRAARDRLTSDYWTNRCRSTPFNDPASPGEWGEWTHCERVWRGVVRGSLVD